MTRDQILEMAEQASSFGKDSRLYFIAEVTPEVIERFAALVAEQERELCAKVCDRLEVLHGAPECAAAIRARKDQT